MELPYSNEYLVYNFDEHRYVLTPSAVYDKLGTDLNVVLNKGRSANVQNLPQMVLDDISSLVYSEIYRHSNQNDIQEYLLAKCESARPMIEKAMLEQVKYFLVNGSLDNYAGVDLKKGSVMPRFDDRILAPRSKEILSRELEETGTSILYGGHYPMLFKKNYKEMGY